MGKKRKREIESYPTRQIRLKDKTWEALKSAKLKYGGTWEKFVLNLITNNK